MLNSDLFYMGIYKLALNNEVQISIVEEIDKRHSG